MKWLEKINLSVVIERLGSFTSALLLFTVIGLCLFTGYRLGNYYHCNQVRMLEQQQKRLEELYHKQDENVARIHSLEIELTVEQLANQQAQMSLKTAAEQQSEIKKRLIFYEKVMAPEKQSAGLLVENVQITETKTPRNYHFQIALVQQQLKRRYSKGYINVVFIGQQKGKLVKLKLANISGMSKKSTTFSFKYFQVLNGEFTLPEGFKPEKVQVSAILTKSKSQKYTKIEKSVLWQVSH